MCGMLRAPRGGNRAWISAPSMNNALVRPIFAKRLFSAAVLPSALSALVDTMISPAFALAEAHGEVRARDLLRQFDGMVARLRAECLAAAAPCGTDLSP